jgi:hypothetical protein
MVVLESDDSLVSSETDSDTDFARMKTSKKSKVLHVNGEHFRTSEAVEGNEVCGIEILPCTSDSLSTLSTAPISSNSGSWSICNNNSIDIIPDIDDDDDDDEDDNVGDNGDEEESAELLNSAPIYYLSTGRSSAKSRTIRSRSLAHGRNTDGPQKMPVRTAYGRRLRMDDYKDVASPFVARHILSIRADSEISDADSEDTTPKMSKSKSDSISIDDCVALIQKKGLYQAAASLTQHDMDYRNLHHPLERPLCKPLCIIDWRCLCQTTLLSSDVIQFRRTLHSPTEVLKPPFLMFPDKSSVVIARDRRARSLKLISRSSILHDAYSHLLDIHGRIGGSEMSIETFAYRDVIPAIVVGKDGFALDASTFRIQLSSWRRNISNARSNPFVEECQSYVLDKTKGDMPLYDSLTQSRLSDEERLCSFNNSNDDDFDGDSITFESQLDFTNKFVCSPDLLTAMTHPVDRTESADFDEIDLLQDEELKAVLQLTEGGDNASTLFPAFSSDTIFTCESMDGLNEEMVDLTKFEDTLRKELETADNIIKGVTAASRRQWEKQVDLDELSLSETLSCFESLDRIESDLRNALERADMIIDQVSTDEEPMRSSYEEDISYMASAENDGSSQGSSHRRRQIRLPGTKGRRVRFATDIQQRYYVKDSPATYRQEIPQRSNRLYVAMEEVYYVFEDLMEEMSYACTRATQYPDERRRPDVPGRRGFAYR